MLADIRAKTQDGAKYLPWFDVEVRDPHGDLVATGSQADLRPAQGPRRHRRPPRARVDALAYHMPQSLVFYISGHGFGHASRDIEVINGLLERVPDLEVHVRTYAPQWLFDLTVRGDVHYHRVDCDTGVVQRDTLNPDIDATVAQAREFYSSFDPRVDEGGRARCERSGPRWSSGTCRRWRSPRPRSRTCRRSRWATSPGTGSTTGTTEWLQGAAWIPPLIRDTHRFAEEAWRLPMHGGFDGFRHVSICRWSRGFRGAIRPR